MNILFNDTAELKTYNHSRTIFKTPTYNNKSVAVLIWCAQFIWVTVVSQIDDQFVYADFYEVVVLYGLLYQRINVSASVAPLLTSYSCKCFLGMPMHIVVSVKEQKPFDIFFLKCKRHFKTIDVTHTHAHSMQTWMSRCFVWRTLLLDSISARSHWIRDNMEASVRPRGHDFLWARQWCKQVQVGVDEPIPAAVDAEALIQRLLRPKKTTLIRFQSALSTTSICF